VFRPAYRRGRIGGDDLADDKPVEHRPHGRELLLHRRRRGLRLQLLYIGGDVMRPDRRERQAALVAPGEELATRPGVRSTRVWVANVGGKEFDITPTRLFAEIGDDRRHNIGRP